MKAHLIYNPVAGPRDARKVLDGACRQLRRRGWTIEPKDTAKPGDAIALARQASLDDCDLVLVAGGDGTVNEVVNGLVGSRTALGVLPVGTGNVWAKQLNVPTYTIAHPRRLQDAAQELADGEIYRIDVGRLGDHHFLCWTGAGLDAQVTAEMEPRNRTTKRLGVLPYMVALMQIARDFEGVRTRVSIDGKIIRGRTILVVASNIRLYAGLPLARGARLDDGLLDVYVFMGLGGLYAVRSFLKVVSNRSLQDARVVHRQARTVDVRADVPLPVHTDGDPMGTTPISVAVVPRSLRVVIPAGAPPDLFIEPPEGRLA